MKYSDMLDELERIATECGAELHVGSDYGMAGGVTPTQKAQAILDAVNEGRGTVGSDRALLQSIVDGTISIEE